MGIGGSCLPHVPSGGTDPCPSLSAGVPLWAAGSPQSWLGSLQSAGKNQPACHLPRFSVERKIFVPLCATTEMPEQGTTRVKEGKHRRRFLGMGVYNCYFTKEYVRPAELFSWCLCMLILRLQKRVGGNEVCFVTPCNDISKSHLFTSLVAALMKWWLFCYWICQLKFYTSIPAKDFISRQKGVCARWFYLWVFVVQCLTETGITTVFVFFLTLHTFIFLAELWSSGPN